MKLILPLLLTLIAHTLDAQLFTKVPYELGIDRLHDSSVDFADVDGNGTQDLLITGSATNGLGYAELFLNDGQGKFFKNENMPMHVWLDIEAGAAVFSDMNGDGAPDFMTSGASVGNFIIVKLYFNDGQGGFNQVNDEPTDTPFEGVYRGSIAFSDVDNNGTSDVVITGENELDIKISKLYLNDGQGNFTEDTTVPFEGIYRGSIAFSDVDNNGGSDLLITGENNSDIKISKLYLNDGQGNFTEDTTVPFEGVYRSSIAFSDVDSNGSLDLVITGETQSEERIAELYLNDGQGNFAEKVESPFLGTKDSAIAFADVDNNNTDDLLITGSSGSNLYLNDGESNFTAVVPSPFENVKMGALAFADVDNNGYVDLLITGEDDSDLDQVTILYKNNDHIVSIDPILEKNDISFSLYPNPTINLETQVLFSTDQNGFVNIKLYDTKGQLLKNDKKWFGIGEHQHAINISNLNKGIYFIQLENGKRKGIQKLLIH